MANSLIVGGLKCGMQVSIACPADYQPDPEGAGLCPGLPRHVPVHPGHPGRGEGRRRALHRRVGLHGPGGGSPTSGSWCSRGYQINDAVMAAAHPGAMVQHCLPAHRGEEITGEVFEAHADEIFDEAENRLHAQKAVLYLLMK